MDDQNSQDDIQKDRTQHPLDSNWMSGRRLLELLPSRIEAVVEISRWSFIKRDSYGKFEFFSPLPTLYNYGSVRGYLGGDGQPLDAVVLGKRVKVGCSQMLNVWGVVEFLDEGTWDHKLILGASSLTCRCLPSFFFLYAAFKRTRAWIRGSSNQIRYLGIEKAKGRGGRFGD